MAVQVKFSALQLAQVQSAIDAVAGLGDATVGKYKDAYNLINPWIQASAAGAATKLFFQQTADINNNAPKPSNIYIRSVTKNGLLLDLKPADPATLQTTSNKIGRQRER